MYDTKLSVITDTRKIQAKNLIKPAEQATCTCTVHVHVSTNED